MSTKVEKPTLGGARIRTRKRNIAVPLDKGSFADTVVTLFLDSKEDDEDITQEQQLEAFVKVLETSDLDFERYGDTLFEVLFTGGASGGSGQKEGELTFEYNLMGVESTTGVEGIKPFLTAFQMILRRRPFLIKNIENIFKRLMQQLAHFTDQQQDNIAKALASVFSIKLGIPAENVMMVLLNDQLVQKGTILRFVTTFFFQYLSTNSLEDLMTILKKSRCDDLMLFFPTQKRTSTAFKAHFTEFDIPSLVQYQERKLAEEGLRELEAMLVEHLEETPNGVTEAIDMVKAAKTDKALPDLALIAVLWRAILSPCALGGKNQQQAQNVVLRQVKAWAKLLVAFVTNKKMEYELINSVQMYCYQENVLMKVFKDIVHLLYECDVCSEEAILYWAKKGTNQKGRAVFMENMAPFLKWLEEAESEDEDDE